jgi:uncharacterized protein (TIGR00251 family)
LASPEKPYNWDGRDLIIELKVTPGSSREDFAMVEEQLCAWLHPQPQDGKANKQLIRLLSKQFRVPQSAISIVRGETNRRKVIRISDPRQVPDFLDAR